MKKDGSLGLGGLYKKSPEETPSEIQGARKCAKEAGGGKGNPGGE